MWCWLGAVLGHLSHQLCFETLRVREREAARWPARRGRMMEVSIYKHLHIIQDKYRREKRMRKAGWLMALPLPIAVLGAAVAGWCPANWGNHAPRTGLTAWK